MSLVPVPGHGDEVAAVLDQAEKGEVAQPLTRIVPPPQYWIYLHRAEDAGRIGRASLFPVYEQRYYDSAYMGLRLGMDNAARESEIWARLQPLVGRRQAPMEMIIAGRAAIAQARALDQAVAGGFGQARVYGKSVGVNGDADVTPPTGFAPADICVSFVTGKSG